jgi:hypothetical protein
MTHLFTIKDDTVIVDKLAVSEINGDVTINGTTTTYGSLNINGDIHSRDITANTLRVKELITDATDFGNWYAKTFDELNGKGMTWFCDEGSAQLIYRTGNRIWATSNIDIAPNFSYMIDNIPVLSSNTLGQTVTKSNLRQVGALNALSVIGATSLGGFAFFDDNTFRIGVGTSEPNAAISIVENNVEIVIGSPIPNLAILGTYSNHDLSIVTDNVPRITIKQSGEVHIGNELSKTSTLKVFGSIYADSIVTDTRLERTSSLEFTETRDENIYNKGLVWKTDSFSKQLLMKDSPSRLWSSESIDIPSDKSYHINGIEVLSANMLGARVLHSNLVTLGNLQELTVSGNTSLHGDVAILSALSVKSLEVDTLIVHEHGISANSILISTNNNDSFYADLNEIVIGSKQNTRRPVKIFGALSIGINNPDPTVNLAVNGAVSFNNKKFITGVAVPTTGSFIKGDICWSENPIEHGYVGWVCIFSGAPGIWKPFGAIGA